ncbi:MAG TPA: hypothetical protein VGQ71_12025 [Terriglobales bacterium]|jgi:hypothetical protein|nr:hypothetical protein [Terriglobales bacterium]
MPAAVLSRFSYPKVPGDSFWSVVDVEGPASYVQVVPGNPPTGGQLITASDCGLQSFDWVNAKGASQAFNAVVVIPAIVGNPTIIRLMWITAATGSQVAPGANLSGRFVRLLAIGR